MSAPLFSILIYHLEAREASLQRLLDCLAPQLEGHGDLVEVLVETDNGEITTGAKRNILLAKARGEYVAFIDDDDLVAPDYVSQIVTALDTRPDTIGLEITTVLPNGSLEPGVHSLRYEAYGVTYKNMSPQKLVWTPEELQECVRATEFGMGFGPPSQLNPTRRELALRVGFPDLTFAEDRAYSAAVRPHLKTEVFIPKALYFYYPDSRHFGKASKK